ERPGSFDRCLHGLPDCGRLGLWFSGAYAAAARRDQSGALRVQSRLLPDRLHLAGAAADGCRHFAEELAPLGQCRLGLFWWWPEDDRGIRGSGLAELYPGALSHLRPFARA